MDEAYEDAYLSAEDHDADEIFDVNEEDADLPKSTSRSRGRVGTPNRARVKNAKKASTPAKAKPPPKSPNKSSRKRNRAKFNEDDNADGEDEVIYILLPCCLN